MQGGKMVIPINNIDWLIDINGVKCEYTGVSVRIRLVKRIVLLQLNMFQLGLGFRELHTLFIKIYISCVAVS